MPLWAVLIARHHAFAFSRVDSTARPSTIDKMRRKVFFSDRLKVLVIGVAGFVVLTTCLPWFFVVKLSSEQAQLPLKHNLPILASVRSAFIWREKVEQDRFTYLPFRREFRLLGLPTMAGFNSDPLGASRQASRPLHLDRFWLPLASRKRKRP